MQKKLFGRKTEERILLEDIFTAYFDCRKNKRNKIDALEFEIDFEKELIKLWKEINNRIYQVSPLDVFISDKPVKREIFAAQFRDRVVHHLLINKFEHIFEKEFIYDTYSCRKGRGTHFGIKRVEKFIRQCSENYKKDCYILKMDIRGYFMSINNRILLRKLENLVSKEYKESDKESLMWLFREITNNNPTKECRIKSARKKWNGLPKSKSLFYAAPGCGMPIGNYTNQILANFYLSSFDHFMKHILGMRYYARYVDDFIIISQDEKKLKNIIPQVREFLLSELELCLHPKKIYFQHYRKGVEFLGVLIKPYRNYVSSRVKTNFWKTVEDINKRLERKQKLSLCEEEKILSQVNSYLGVLSHSNTHNLRRKLLTSFSWRFWGYFKTENKLTKIGLIKRKEKPKKNRRSKKKRQEMKKKRKSIKRVNKELNTFKNYKGPIFASFSLGDFRKILLGEAQAF